MTLYVHWQVYFTRFQSLVSELFPSECCIFFNSERNGWTMSEYPLLTFSTVVWSGKFLTASTAHASVLLKTFLEVAEVHPPFTHSSPLKPCPSRHNTAAPVCPAFSLYLPTSVLYPFLFIYVAHTNTMTSFLCHAYFASTSPKPVLHC